MWQLSNYRNVFRDHRSYWRNKDQFLPMLLLELMNAARRTDFFTHEDQAFLQDAHLRRDQRVAWLNWSRYVALGLLVCAVALHGRSLAIWLPVVPLMHVTGLSILACCALTLLTGAVIFRFANKAAMARAVYRRDAGPWQRARSALAGPVLAPHPARLRAWWCYSVSWLALGAAYNKLVPALYGWSTGGLPLPEVQTLLLLWLLLGLAWLVLGLQIKFSHHQHALTSLLLAGPTLLVAWLNSTGYAVELWQPYGLVTAAWVVAGCSATWVGIAPAGSVRKGVT